MTADSRRLSSRADAKSLPNGFSTMTRRQPADSSSNPRSASRSHTLRNCSGATAR